MDRYAIIDLGTNIFNLLIAAKDETGKPVFLNYLRIPVNLGEGGINQGLITPAAFARGVDAMCKHMETIEKSDCKKIHAFATSAVRDAENNKEFVDAVYEKTGIRIDIIDGMKEAELIYAGAKNAFPLKEKTLIMDIGGGSTEMIIADDHEIYFKRSFRIGVSRLREKFNFDSPSTPVQVMEMEKFLDDTFGDFFKVLKTHEVKTLLGSSGSFESFTDILWHRMHQKPFDFETNTSAELPLEPLMELLDELIHSDHQFRLSLKGLSEFRRDFITYSSVITRSVINNGNISSANLSTYALKEGAFFSLMELD